MNSSKLHSARKKPNKKIKSTKIKRQPKSGVLADTAIVENSYLLWKKLKTEGGLDVSRNPNGQDGYDVVLELQINKTLFPGQNTPLEQNLKRTSVGIEIFLAAFLQAQLPFSKMLEDVLRFFEKAGAQYGTRNFKIEFNFEEGKKLGLDLEHFREWTRIMQKVATTMSLWDWSPIKCWQLVYKLRDIHRDKDNNKRIPIHDEEVKRWCDDRGLGSNREFLYPPAIPRSGDPTVDALILRCESLIRAFHDECLKIASNYDALMSRDAVAFENLETKEASEAIRLVASDFWSSSLAEELTNLAEGIREGKAAPLSLEPLHVILDSIDGGRVRMEELRESLQSLLNLPSWKFRHELYAVWVGAQIVDAMDEFEAMFHIEDNTLAFPFSGAHLATFTAAKPSIFMFWTELRTPLPTKSKSGRANIQPDYRIVRMPFDPAKTTILVVECKQYRRSSTSNFSEALNDYAIGCPNAHVILVNNGPIGTKAIGSVDPGHAVRTDAISDFRPDSNDAKSRFRQIVQRVVFGKINPARPTHGGDIRLSWEDYFADLDLLVVLRPANAKDRVLISYKNIGSLDDWPKLRLDEDVQSGPGEEIVRVSEWQDGIYDVYVNNYSSSKCPDSPYTCLTIKHPELESSVVVRGKRHEPVAGIESCWHACSIHGLTGEVTRIDRYYASPPL